MEKKIVKPYLVSIDGRAVTLGLCCLCGRKLQRYRVNKTGARCPYEGAQYNSAGDLIRTANVLANTAFAQPAQQPRHTPEPWFVQDAKGTLCAFTVRTKERDIAFVAQTGSNDTDLANARLIASAPDLLKACKLLAENLASALTFPERWDGYKAAIALVAKIEGN